MKLTKLFLLFLFFSIKGFSQQAVLTSSGEKVILNFLSSLGGTVSGTLTTKAGINNTGTITNTGAFINNGNLTVNGNGTITGTLTTSGTINDLTVSRGGGNVNGNTAVGGSALNANNNTGINNAAFGSEALLLNQGGGHNTALGKDALRTNVSGNYSTAVGYQSLNVNTVSNNTAIGYRSMFTNSSGTDNTAIGYQSLDGNSTGTQNTAIGAKANMGLVDLSNTTAIGYFAIATTSNTIQLGNAYITKINTSGAITAGGMQNTPIGSSIANTGAFTTLAVSDATTLSSTLAVAGTTNIGTNTSIASALLQVSSTTQGFLPPRMTGAQRVAISAPVSGLVVWCSNCGNNGELQVYNGTTWTNMIGGTAAVIPPTYIIGESALGGKIAYILQPLDPGYNADVQHGLVATAADISTGAAWGCSGTLISGADATALGTGNQNTIDIMNGCITAGIAAALGGDLVQGGYSDWYLPSKDELNILYLNREAIGGFSFVYYWSSTESDSTTAFYLYFGGGGTSNAIKSTSSNFHVRAIRAF